MKEFIEIPFSAKDSELGGWEYNIPEGYTASIENGKIIVKKGESEDERIRKELLNAFQESEDSLYMVLTPHRRKSFIAWLEKQGEQKNIHLMELKAKAYDDAKDRMRYAYNQNRVPIGFISEIFPSLSLYENQGKRQETEDGEVITYSESEGYKVGEPKFKVGDWVVQGCNILKIRCVGDEYYCYETVGGYVDDMLVSEIDSLYHLWTIKDAKDGDVLCDGQLIILFKQWEDGTDYNFVIAHAGIDVSGKLQITDGHWLINDNSHPATKEQRELLFQKMKVAGYKWDDEKKELKKIHVIDEGKDEMDYCFTKMMNGEKVSSAWTEDDEIEFNHILKTLTSVAKEQEIKGYNNLISNINWLKSLKERMKEE